MTTSIFANFFFSFFPIGGFFLLMENHATFLSFLFCWEIQTERGEGKGGRAFSFWGEERVGERVDAKIIQTKNEKNEEVGERREIRDGETSTS